MATLVELIYTQGYSGWVHSKKTNGFSFAALFLMSIHSCVKSKSYFEVVLSFG